MGIIQKSDVIKSVEKNEADILNTTGGNSIKPGMNWPADDTNRFIIRKLDGTFVSVPTGAWTGSEWEQADTEAIDFVTGLPEFPHKEGRLYYDEASKSLAYYIDSTSVKMNIGRENWVRVYNNTGAEVTNGQVVHLMAVDAGSGLPTIDLSDSDDYNENKVIGVATEDIADGAQGEITTFGLVSDIDTSGLQAGAVVYLDTTPGQMTTGRPEFPAKPIIVGTCVVSDASAGKIFVTVQEDIYQHQFDGCIIEKHDTEVKVESDNNVYMYVEKLGGGDIPVQLGSDVRILDCTTVKGYPDAPTETRARIAMTQGTATLPQYNSIFLKLNGDDPELGVTTTYPGVPFAPVAQASIRTFTDVTAEGPDMHRRATSSISHDGRGRNSYFTERWAVESAKWFSGCTPSASIDTVPTPDLLDLDTIAGVVYQTHRQTMPALSVSTDGVYVANGPGGSGLANYTKYTNLTQVCGYTSADEARNTNCRGHLVIFGVVNKDTSECKLFVNLPSSLYGGNDSGAYGDYDGTAAFTVPTELRYTAFLIAQVPYDLSNSGNTVEFINPAGNTEIINLLGNPIGISGGASGGGASFIPNLTQVLTEGNDAGGDQITNMADGTAASDAATVGQLSDYIKTDGTTAGATAQEQVFTNAVEVTTGTDLGGAIPTAIKIPANSQIGTSDGTALGGPIYITNDTNPGLLNSGAVVEIFGPISQLRSGSNTAGVSPGAAVIAAAGGGSVQANVAGVALLSGGGDGITVDAFGIGLDGDTEIKTGHTLTFADGGATIDEFSTDGTLGGASNTAVPTELAVLSYANDNLRLSASDKQNLVLGTTYLASDPNTLRRTNYLNQHANSPNSSYIWFITEMYYSATGRIVQTAQSYQVDPAEMHFRSSNDDGVTWTDWVKVLDGTADNTISGSWTFTRFLILTAGITLDGKTITEFSIDGTMAGNSNDALPTEKAVKTYVDGEVEFSVYDGTGTTGTINPNYANGNYHRIVASGDITIGTPSNLPEGKSMIVRIDNASGYTVYGSNGTTELIASSETGVYSLVINRLTSTQYEVSKGAEMYVW